MLRLKLSKLKQVLASLILPRLFVRGPKFITESFHNRTPVQLNKVRKSTNSKSNDEEIAKKMRIIEKCFETRVLDIETKDCNLITEEKPKDNIFPPNYYKMSRCEKCEAVISKLFDDKSNVGISDNTGATDPEGAIMQATTSKLEEEKLAQKIEIIDETPHVEAHAPKIEGFNTNPRVLGHESSYYEVKNDQNISGADQLNLDEVAKRCLGSPIGKIDKKLVDELKNSQNDIQPKVDLDFLRNQCIEKHFLTNTSGSELNNFESIKQKDTAVDFGCKLDRICPTHLDVLPLLNVNDKVNDIKEYGFIQNFSAVYLTKEVDEPPNDLENSLSPYEQPAIPFYEYINKENIVAEDDSKIEAAATETIQGNEIIFNDEQLEREGIRQERTSLEVPITAPLNPKPNVTHFADVAMDTSYPTKKEDNFATQRIYTSTSHYPTGWYPEDTYQRGSEEQTSSAISATLQPIDNQQTIEMPQDTAISAHQNPGEYYSFSISENIVTFSQPEPLQHLFAENPVTQNVVFSALPQLIEIENPPINQKVNTQEPISNMLSEPRSKQEMVNATIAAPNLEKTACTQEPSFQLESSIPLSVILKQVREINRLEYCRDLFSKVEIKLDQQVTCPDKGKSSKSSEKKSACETKTKPPDPCKPKTCEPPKKNPCAKFIPILLTTVVRNDVPLEFLVNSNGVYGDIMIPLVFINEDILERIQKLGRQLKYLKNEIESKKNILYARNFEPWIPIPSWPIPKKEKARTLVCPKDGCKLPVPKSNQVCKDKQCLGLPKKNFSFSEFFSYNI